MIGVAWRAVVLAAVMIGFGLTAFPAHASEQHPRPSADDWAEVLLVCGGGAVAVEAATSAPLTAFQGVSAALFPVMALCVIIYGQEHMNAKAEGNG